MKGFEYRGNIYTADKVNSAVTMAAGGKPPRDRGDEVSATDWLAGFLEASAGSDAEESVIYAINMVFRTGDSRHLAVIAPLGLSTDILDPQTLMETLNRPHLYRDGVTAPVVAEALCRAIMTGRLDYPLELRLMANDKKLRGKLVALYFQKDEEWALANLDRVLTKRSPRAGDFLRVGLEALGEDAPAVMAKIAERKAEWPERIAEDLQSVLDDFEVAVPEAEVEETSETSEEEVVEQEAELGSALPWRSNDGRWFEIPDDVDFLAGELVLRRGPSVKRVDAQAVEAFEVDSDRARALLTGEMTQMFERGRKAFRALLEQGASRVEDPGIPTVGEFEHSANEAAETIREIAQSAEVKNFFQALGKVFKEVSEHAANAMKEGMEEEKGPDSDR